MSINFSLGIALYLIIGFLFMLVSAKKGWMGRYDPAMFFWLGWPVVILFGILSIPLLMFSYLSDIIDNFVRPFRKNINDDFRI